MRILFLVQDFPYPPANGITRKVYSVLSHLSGKGWKCDILCFGDRDSVNRAPHLEAALPGVKVLSIIPYDSGVKAILKKAISLLSGLPPSLGGFSDRRFRETFQKACREYSYDVVHYDVINMAQYRQWGPDLPSVFSSSDAISLFYEGMIKESRGLFRRMYLMISRRLIAKYERAVYPKFDKVHVVSKKDSDHLKKLCPGLDVEIIPITANESFIDFLPPRPAPDKILKAAFTGNIDIPGIANGLFEFLDTAYRGMIPDTPPFEFHVLGPKASPEDIKRISSFPNVKYFSWVEDYRGFLLGIDILLALDKSGTGIKNRVFDAMALGKPVVGTSIAFSGIDVENRKNCFVCNNPAETAAAIRLLLEDPVLRENIGKAARELMLSRYSAAVNGQKWEALYAGLAHKR